MTEAITSFTVEEFFSLLSRSGLLNEKLFEQQKERFSAESTTPKAILAQMLTEHLLTPFQAKQLSERRHRGFFLSEKYKILDFLGQGGMSRVLLCEHLMLQRLVAVKILHKSLDKFPGAADRFTREARASASMDHPNIARVFDLDRTGLGPCIVMEYVDGTNLHDLAVKHDLLSVSRVANYISQAAVALQQAHVSGLVHRDVKPANLMLERNGNIKLLDLGLARYFDPSRSDNLTQQIDASCIIGTADYIAPEQVMESSSADIRADIYSLGYTMYFLLTRKLPAGDGPVMRKLLWHQTRNPEPIRTLRPEVPEKLAEVLERMIKKSRDERYQTPAEVVEALAPWTSEPVAPPSDDEMPKTRASGYRLGLCPPPDSSKFVSPAPVGSAGKETSSVSTNKGSSAVHQQSKSEATESQITSGSVIGYSTQLGSEAIMPTGSTIRSTRTNDVMSISSETIAKSNSSYIRGLTIEDVRKPMFGFLRRHVLSITMIVLGVAVGSFLTQWYFLAQMARESAEMVRSYRQSGPLPRPIPEPKKVADSNPDAPVIPSSAILLRGGGSTLIRPVMEQWSRLYESETGIKMEYSGVGSSKGFDGLTSNFVDFTCIDTALTDQQLALAGVDVLQLPLAVCAVVPTYNVQLDDHLPLRFTGAVLANIYLGKIKYWNDPAIVASNPGRNLPDVEIVVIHRANGSGTSAIWSEYLSQASSSWKSQYGVGSTVDWPVGIAAESNDAVAALVNRTHGAIGYVEKSCALAHGLAIGQVKNQAGMFVDPNVETISSAVTANLKNFQTDLRQSLIDTSGANSYPICGLTWIVFRATPNNERGAEFAKFARWAATTGQSQLTNLQFGPLPSELAERVTGSLDKVIPPKP